MYESTTYSITVIGNNVVPLYVICDTPQYVVGNNVVLYHTVRGTVHDRTCTSCKYHVPHRIGAVPCPRHTRPPLYLPKSRPCNAHAGSNACTASSHRTYHVHVHAVVVLIHSNRITLPYHGMAQTSLPRQDIVYHGYDTYRGTFVHTYHYH